MHWKHEVGLQELHFRNAHLNLTKDNSDQIVHWHYVVRAKLSGDAEVENREQRLDRERRIACECHKRGETLADRLRLWEEKTGYKKQAFYNRMSEAKASGLFQRICGNVESWNA